MPDLPETIDLPGGYRITLWTPPGPAPASGWPVLWVLDGAGLFPLVAEAARLLSRREDATGVPPMLVAGIDHAPADQARRTLDFSFGPAHDPAGLAGQGATGGGEALLALLTGAARDAVAARRATDPARHLLLGHSLAGYFALHALARADFAVVGAISPSVWWDERGLLALLRAMPDRGQALFTGAGEREEPAVVTTPADERRKARRIVGNAQAVAGIAARRLEPARAVTAIGADEDHASAFIALLPHFLRFAGERLRQARNVAPPST